MGAGAGDEGSAGAEHLDGAEVELLVAAHGAFGGALGLGEGGWVEDDGVVLLAGGLVLAEELEGVGFEPLDLGLKVGVELSVAVGYFEGAEAGVDSGDLTAVLGHVEGESALISADVERGAGCVAGCGGVVEALVEEGSRLLARACVEVKTKAVDGEDGGELWCFGGVLMVWGVEGTGCGVGELFEFADLWVGALPEGDTPGVGVYVGAEAVAQDFGEEVADVVLCGPLGEELEDDEVVVAVGDDAGEVVGLGEDEAAGVVFHGLGGYFVAEGEGGEDSLAELLEVGGSGECGFVRDDSYCDLRRGAVEAGAEGDAAAVHDGDECSGLDLGGADWGDEGFDV